MLDVGLAHGAQVVHQRQRRGVADLVAAAVGDREREAGALQQAAEVADLAHRRDARAEAAEGLDLGLGEGGAQLGQGLAAEEGGEEEAVGPEGAAGLHELADRVVGPVQREGMDDEVVGGRLEVEDVGVGHAARVREAEGGGPEACARADDRGGAKAPVNLGEPFCDLGGDRLLQEVRGPETGGAGAAQGEQVGVEQGGRRHRAPLSLPLHRRGSGR